MASMIETSDLQLTFLALRKDRLGEVQLLHQADEAVMLRKGFFLTVQISL